MKNEEFGCAMQACRKVILHSSLNYRLANKIEIVINKK